VEYAGHTQAHANHYITITFILRMFLGGGNIVKFKAYKKKQEIVTSRVSSTSWS
jgi:hypothetical protein